MKKILVQTLSGQVGQVARIGSGVVVAGATKALTSLGLHLDDATSTWISVVVGLFITNFLNEWILKNTQEGVKQIQDILPSYVKSDGVPGDVTIQAVENAVTEAKQNQ